MTTFRTSGCAEHGQAEVTVTFVEPPLIPGGERLILGYVEDAVAKGTRFKAGETMLIGGSLLRLCQRADGTLGVEERVPAPKETWVEGVDRTVREVMLQKYVNESVGLELAHPSPGASLLVARCAEESVAVVLRRAGGAQPRAGLSGWTLECAEAHEHESQFVLPVLALSALRPDLVPFLALPDGVVVTISRGPITVTHEGVEKVPAPGSFLEKRNARAERKT